MKSEELFRLGYEAAVERMKAFDGPAMVTDELVEDLETNVDAAYQEFKTTEPGKTLVLAAETREDDRVNSAKWRGFRAGHRAAVRTTDSFFRTDTAMSRGLKEYVQDKEERDLANFQAAEKG